MAVGKKPVTCVIWIKFEVLNQHRCHELFSHCFKRKKNHIRDSTVLGTLWIFFFNEIHF